MLARKYFDNEKAKYGSFLVIIIQETVITV